MVESNNFICLEDLLDEEVTPREDEIILNRLILLAEKHLPVGWRNWKTINLTWEELFGDDLDPQVLNKIRFALPTRGIAEAFFPSATHLTERQYRACKIRMLQWSFCRALIISPPFITRQLNCSVE